MESYDIQLENKSILITGVAGFIGSNLAKQLLEMRQNIQIIGIDNMNDYYSVELKESRLAQLNKDPNFIFVEGSIADASLIKEVLAYYSRT